MHWVSLIPLLSPAITVAEKVKDWYFNSKKLLDLV